ncbi:hypothetical protein [Streptomyces flavofungini]|uniref:Secreted protein n=1 Tax=Streptomyces flavofungini TaxID=68200 RepID=A0ABS0XBF5_9ACTN|nr:hypothetical protein [Streptomyces flavofungini]MBJ3810558.1 hypothetical protein [Streptomyces flavofungini]GHC83956.1 hypothetical protein GCM10010349_68590 [Streptomyces flavofungini]
MPTSTIRRTRLRTAVTSIGVTGVFAGLALSGASSAGASSAAPDEKSPRTSIAAPIGFHGVSGSSKAKISGTYQYWYAGKDTSGRAFYDGKFSGATAQDRVSGDGYEAVLALKYDEFTGGGWRTVKNRVAVVNSTKSWSFRAKDKVVAYACDRKVGTKKLLNCRAWRF